MAEHPPLTPEFTARWRLVRPLGAGGMGAVWVGQDLSLDREVAIKFLLKDAPPETLARFRREGKLMARVASPHVVQVLDTGAVGGAPYLVCQYVPGTSLEALLRDSGPLAPARAAALAVDVLEGLAVCHDAGIVHRDLKPANVLIDERGRALVADLGISSLQDAGWSVITDANMLIGTPAYMAPEQTRDHAVGPAADLHACGVLLYEMLCGHPPHVSENIGQLLRMIQDAPPPPLPETVPAWLADLVHALLAKQPADRPGTARAVADRLRRGFAGQAADAPVPPVPVAAPASVTQRVTKNRASAATRAMATPPPARGAASSRRAAAAAVALAACTLGAWLALRIAPPLVLPVASPSPATVAIPSPQPALGQVRPPADPALAVLAGLAAGLDRPVPLAPWAAGATAADGPCPLVIGHRDRVTWIEARGTGVVTLPSGRTLGGVTSKLRIDETGLVEGLNFVHVKGAQIGARPHVHLTLTTTALAPPGPEPPRGADVHREFRTKLGKLKEIRPVDKAMLLHSAARDFREMAAPIKTAKLALIHFIAVHESRRNAATDLFNEIDFLLAERAGAVAVDPATANAARAFLEADQRAIATHPDRWDLWHELAAQLVEVGHQDAARAAFVRALEIWPHAPYTWYLLFNSFACEIEYKGEHAQPYEVKRRLMAQARAIADVAELLLTPAYADQRAKLVRSRKDLNLR